MNPDINPTPPAPTPAPATPPVSAPIAEPTPAPTPSMADGGRVNLPNDFTLLNYGLGILIFVGMIYSIRTNRALLNKLYE